MTTATALQTIATTTTTAEVLASMWTENTGRHMLDSGGAYGRNWERNQGMDAEMFLSQPRVTLDARFGWPEIIVSAFHWLNEILDFDPLMQRRFELFSMGSEDPHLVDAERFVEWIDDSAEWGHESPMSANTYNGESWIDSVLQYQVFTYKGEDYVLLQYHGGCDVRGGYTAPKAFRLTGYEGRYELYTEGNVSLYCTEHQGASLGEGLFGEARDTTHGWMSNSSGIEWTDHDGNWAKSDDFKVVEPEDADPYVACPHCGSKLEVDVYFGS